MRPVPGETWLLPHHLGALHPLEQALTLVLALGPLVLLAVTVLVSRRRHARDGDGPQADHRDQSGQSGRTRL